MSQVAALPLRAEFARKALHVATAALPVGLSFGWGDALAARNALTAAAALALVIEALRLRSSQFRAAFDAAFAPLLRPHERRALTGATWLALSMALVLWFAPLQAAIAALWAAAVGDAAAAVIGRSAARWRGETTPRKSLIGSVAALAATAAGVVWLTAASAMIALLLGAVAALAERPARPLDDNARIALAVALAATALGLR